MIIYRAQARFNEELRIKNEDYTALKQIRDVLSEANYHAAWERTIHTCQQRPRRGRIMLNRW